MEYFTANLWGPDFPASEGELPGRGKARNLSQELGAAHSQGVRQPRPAQSVPVLTLRYGGLRIKIERIAIGVDIWCSVSGSTADIARDVTDMRTVLRYIYENRQEYRRQELEWWNIGAKYKYPYTEKGALWKLK